MTLTHETLVLGILTVALAAIGACSPAMPAAPTYSKDVAPIFAAHCNRCHSARGPDGGFQGDPGPNPLKPTACHLDFYDPDPATCPSCMGAHACAGLISTFINPASTSRMPPPPATKLSDWEFEVIERWAQTNPPPP